MLTAPQEVVASAVLGVCSLARRWRVALGLWSGQPALQRSIIAVNTVMGCVFANAWPSVLCLWSSLASLSVQPTTLTYGPVCGSTSCLMQEDGARNGPNKSAPMQGRWNEREIGRPPWPAPQQNKQRALQEKCLAQHIQHNVVHGGSKPYRRAMAMKALVMLPVVWALKIDPQSQRFGVSRACTQACAPHCPASSRPAVPCMPTANVWPYKSNQSWSVELGERILAAAHPNPKVSEKSCGGFKLFGDSAWCLKAFADEPAPLGLSFGIELSSSRGPWLRAQRSCGPLFVALGAASCAVAMARMAHWRETYLYVSMTEAHLADLGQRAACAESMLLQTPHLWEILGYVEDEVQAASPHGFGKPCHLSFCPDGGSPDHSTCTCRSMGKSTSRLSSRMCIISTDPGGDRPLETEPQRLVAEEPEKLTRFWSLTFHLNRLYALLHGYRFRRPDVSHGELGRMLSDGMEPPRSCDFVAWLDSDAYIASSEPLETVLEQYGLLNKSGRELSHGVRGLSVRRAMTMPAVGLGCWKAEKGVTEEVVYNAIKVGYRHIDSAADYGNETEVGAGIRRAIADELCTRSDLWVTSKLWNTYHHREHVPMACQRTLDDLGLDYLDLYLIHFPISLAFVPFEERYPPEWTDKRGNAGHLVLDPVPYRETWEAMEALQDLGKAKHIGVSNLTVQSLLDVLSYCRVKPAVNQIESHVYLQQPDLVQFCIQQGIGVTCFSPFGAKSYVSIGLAAPEEDCFHEALLQGQIILRFLVQRGCSVVPKSQSVERLKENLDVFGFELSAEEMQQVQKLERGRRFNDPGVFARGWGAPGSVVAAVGCPIYA
ncbi:unnamed protein product [Effrenium voratum]|nr:unnamed protein product [Effrenium voratum]